jgi:hypothetical protein
MEYVVRAKLSKDDGTYIERIIKAEKMETRYEGGAAFFNGYNVMVAYFPIVFSVHAREAIP